MLIRINQIIPAWNSKENMKHIRERYYIEMGFKMGHEILLRYPPVEIGKGEIDKDEHWEMRVNTIGEGELDGFLEGLMNIYMKSYNREEARKELKTYFYNHMSVSNAS